MVHAHSKTSFSLLRGSPQREAPSLSLKAHKAHAVLPGIVLRFVSGHRSIGGVKGFSFGAHFGRAGDGIGVQRVVQGIVIDVGVGLIDAGLVSGCWIATFTDRLIDASACGRMLLYLPCPSLQHGAAVGLYCSSLRPRLRCESDVVRSLCASLTYPYHHRRWRS